MENTDNQNHEDKSAPDGGLAVQSTNNNPTRTVKRVDTVVAHLTPDESLYRLTLTKPLRKIGVTPENYKDSSLLFRPEQGEKGEVVAHLMRGVATPDGRTQPQWRAITASSEEGTVYRITLPQSLIEEIGVDVEEGSFPVFDVWAGEGTLLFEEVSSRMVHHSLDVDDLVQYGLTQREAEDYQAVVREGRDPADLAEERGLSASEDAKHYKPHYYINQNVANAKRKLSDAGIL